MVGRRGFLFLLGAGAAGLWLGGSGLVQLGRRFVLALAGACSFCGKDVRCNVALAGVAGRPARICHQCVGLCMDIIAGSRPEERPATRAKVPFEDTLASLLSDLAVSRGNTELLLAEAKRRLDGPPIPSGLGAFACSFCDATRPEAAKLIAGPRVLICDLCVGDAAALVSGVPGRSGSPPWTLRGRPRV